jgi:site-specific recombinase XerD
MNSHPFLLRQFDLYLRAQSLSIETRASYRTAASQYLRWASALGPCDLEAVSVGEVRTFLSELEAHGRSRSTCRVRSAGLRAFLGFLLRRPDDRRSTAALAA